MDIILSLTIAVLSSIISHYILKWLDNSDNEE